ncbi:MAG: Cytochrome-c peroxidase [Panacagrimonas sp.]|jgi:cytochrome c peroxidase|nr:cytochrome c peroxidase [Panacagrimonas sp.]MCC2658670.1 Cytochrome-c peroxidase [Panacagrimonas sp.]
MPSRSPFAPLLLVGIALSTIPPSRAVDAAAVPSLGLPAARFVAASEAETALGRALFFDRRLSFNGTMSCSMCHVPEQGFASTASRTALGIEGRSLPRNAPTLLNVGWLTRLFHDGRENSLANQAWAPLLHPLEMANPSAGYVLEKIAATPEYGPLFVAAYGDATPSMSRVGTALEAFERSLVAAGSRFDRWFYGAQADALTPQEQAGFRLFTGKARCSSCHLVGKGGTLFTDERYHATGASLRDPDSGAHPVRLAADTATEITDVELAAFVSPTATDLGRFEITLAPEDRFAFRTPGLRNVERTAPYMHDGSLPTLEAVVGFYNAGGGRVPNKSVLIGPLELTAREQAELALFLRTLTSPAVETLPAQVRRTDP